MKTKKHIYKIFILLFLVQQLIGQGDLAFEQSLLRDYKIFSVTVREVPRSKDVDTIKTFEEIYEFDGNGNLNFLTYWQQSWYLMSKKTLAFEIIKDSAVCLHDTIVPTYAQLIGIMSSEKIKYNQYKVHGKALKAIYNKVEASGLTRINPYNHNPINNCGMLVDTLFFEKKYKLNIDLLRKGYDSLKIFKDSIIMYETLNNKIVTTTKYSHAASGYLQIEKHKTRDGSHKDWLRIYYFDENGRLKQDIHNNNTTNYYYDKRGFLVRKELKEGNNIVLDLSVEYKNSR